MEQRLAWIHVPLALWAAGVEFTGWMCPLTPLEHWLCLKGGIAVEKLGFVEQYLLSHAAYTTHADCSGGYCPGCESGDLRVGT